MADTTTMTVRLSQSVHGQLEQLARSTGRSRSFLAAEAIATYVELNRWQVAGIEAAIAEADAGALRSVKSRSRPGSDPGAAQTSCRHPYRIDPCAYVGGGWPRTISAACAVTSRPTIRRRRFARRCEFSPPRRISPIIRSWGARVVSSARES